MPGQANMRRYASSASPPSAIAVVYSSVLLALGIIVALERTPDGVARVEGLWGGRLCTRYTSVRAVAAAFRAGPTLVPALRRSVLVLRKPFDLYGCSCYRF